MRIALVSPYDLDVSGGVQAQVLGLREELAERNHDVVAVGPTSSVGWRANGSVAPISLSPRELGRVKGRVSNADVVHIHEPFVPFVGWGALRTRRPTVATFHADPSRLVRAIYSAAGVGVERMLSNIAVVTAVSPVAASVLRCEPDIIPNGIVLPPPPGTKVRGSVVFLGRDDPRKGLDVLLEAWSTVRARHDHAQLTVIGRVERPPQPGVTFAGFVDEREKARLLGQAEIMVAPQTGGESFGITVAEGLAAGCQIIASDLPAFAHVLGGVGTLFKRGHAAELAVLLVDRLGNDAHESVFQRSYDRGAIFGWNRVADLYESAYRRALGESL